MKNKYELKNEIIRKKFQELKRNHPERLRLRLESILEQLGIRHGEPGRLGEAPGQGGNQVHRIAREPLRAQLGYKVRDTLQILGDHQIRVAGICGMFSAANDLSSNSGIARQHAVDYLKRTIPFAAEVGGDYMLVVPGAVSGPAPTMLRSSTGRPPRFNWWRIFSWNAGSRPPSNRSDPPRSVFHTIADAKRYIQAVNHPGIKHINGDIYHMQSEESHIGMAILEAGKMLTNLHVADSNRCALGDGAMDIDTLIMALYVIGYNRPGCYVTPEPLGPGGDPYPAMHGKPNAKLLDRLVQTSAVYFRERERCVRES